MSEPKKILICMRLADMHRVHPDQIEGKCSRCGEVVGIYPSGQRVLKAYPPGEVELECQICRSEIDVLLLAPGAHLEPLQSKRKE